MNLINCPYCGEEVKEEAIKCKHCGTHIRSRFSDEVWYRNLPKRQFLGICAMLAHNFHLPVTLVRLIMIALCFITFKGVILFYLFLYLVTPFEKDRITPIQNIFLKLKSIYRNLTGDVKLKNQGEINKQTTL